MLNIILFGPPGCGKGTQSARIACRFDLVHLSSGELFRKEARKASKLGQKVNSLMKRGLLVPDPIVLRSVHQEASKHPLAGGFVFDGFPRTLYQAQVLDRFLEKMFSPVNIVFCMEVEREELMSRMLGRAEDSGRHDDNEKTIKTRMKIYNQFTLPIKEYYQRQNKLAAISGMAPVKVVSARIASIVEHYLEKNEIINPA